MRKRFTAYAFTGSRLLAEYPAWNPGDLVEQLGTGLRGVIVRTTTLDYSRWEIVLGNGKFAEVPSRELMAVLPPGGPIGA